MTAEPQTGSPRGLAAMRRALYRIGRAELVLAVAAFAFVAALTIYQVVLRYGFGGSIWWAQEIAQLAMLIAYFFGIAYVYKANQDIAIRFIAQRLPARWQPPLYLGIQILIIAFCALVAVEGLLLAPSQLRFKTYILNIPKFYSTLSLIIASVSMAATAAYFALATWRRWRDSPGGLHIDPLEAELTVLHETHGVT